MCVVFAVLLLLLLLFLPCFVYVLFACNLRVCCDSNCKCCFGRNVLRPLWVDYPFVLRLPSSMLLLLLIHSCAQVPQRTRSDLNLYLALFCGSGGEVRGAEDVLVGQVKWVGVWRGGESEMVAALRLSRKTFYSRDMLHFSWILRILCDFPPPSSLLFSTQCLRLYVFVNVCLADLFDVARVILIVNCDVVVFVVVFARRDVNNLPNKLQQQQEMTTTNNCKMLKRKTRFRVSQCDGNGNGGSDATATATTTVTATFTLTANFRGVV